MSRTLTTTCIFFLCLVGLPAEAQEPAEEVPLKAESFGIDWSNVSGNGVESVGGSFDLFGITGQPVVGAISGGSYRLESGFLAGVFEVIDTPIFSDGFEGGNTSVWSKTVGG